MARCKASTSERGDVLVGRRTSERGDNAADGRFATVPKKGLDYRDFFHYINRHCDLRVELH